MKSLLIISLVLVGLALGMMVYLYFFQYRLLYPAPRQPLPNPLPEGMEKIDLAEGYGLFLSAHRQAPSPLLIFTHGNGETAFMWHEAFEPLRAAGLSVLLLEYPGYGAADGSPTLATIQAGVLSAYDRMAERADVQAAHIVAYGRSIGGGAASLLAAQRPVRALALEASFSTLAQLVKEKGYPAFLLRDRYDNEAVVRALQVPLFLYHGTLDPLVPLSHSECLAQAGRDVTLVTETCAHNDCPRPWTALLEFLARIPALQPQLLLDGKMDATKTQDSAHGLR